MRNNGRAAGPDGIAELIKYGGAEIASDLKSRFNAMLQSPQKDAEMG
jgi:hypothetical protein